MNQTSTNAFTVNALPLTVTTLLLRIPTIKNEPSQNTNQEHFSPAHTTDRYTTNTRTALARAVPPRLASCLAVHGTSIDICPRGPRNGMSLVM